ncbi:MAG: hypothetical protein AB7N80_05690 [Bdellovibrionales bacterium]
MKSKSLLIPMLFGAVFAVPTFAFDEHGRLSFGAFFSHEKHEPEPFSTDNNDFATSSARFYYRAGDLLTREWVFTSDLRDKHDFFNKLDRERQELTDHNSFQVRQLSLRKNPNSEGLIFEVGRYAIPDAGATFNDGASIGWRLSQSFSAEAFAGLNPKQYDKSYLQFREKATTFGAIASLTPKTPSWTTRKELHVAHVTQQYDGQTDRQYLYQRSAYQWAVGSQVSSMVYLDFVPRTYVQNGLALYDQKWTSRFFTQLGLSAYDVVEYRRAQDLREQLEPSPYKEASLRGTLLSSPTLRWTLQTRYGKRSADDLERLNVTGECKTPRIHSKNIDMSYRLAQKKEFTKTGTYGGYSFGYFTDKDEYEFSIDLGAETETTGQHLHPIIGEATYAFQVSRRFFGAASLQYQRDEKVEIYSALFQVTLLFGNQKISPLRDGTPPRGRL